jgi:beta-N-acetylhexosaminidase
MPFPAILSCAGLTLTPDETALFRDTRPHGLILFARNCESPAQVASLVASFRQTAGEDAAVLIDQEGGRVARLKPPHWPEWPAPGTLPDADSCYDHGYSIGNTLMQLGINVDCLPLLDVPVEGAHCIIGDRAFGPDPQRVIAHGRAMCRGLKAAGVHPVLKHIPGHGRAACDSHEALPTVTTPRDELERTDFLPFRALASEAPYAMTAHVVYTALDPDQPATLSAPVLRMIREEIGFTGLIMSDDLSMKALQGDVGSLAVASLRAGCDLALYCKGDFAELRRITEALSESVG